MICSFDAFDTLFEDQSTGSFTGHGRCRRRSDVLDKYGNFLILHLCVRLTRYIEPVLQSLCLPCKATRPEGHARRGWRASSLRRVPGRRPQRTGHLFSPVSSLCAGVSCTRHRRKYLGDQCMIIVSMVPFLVIEPVVIPMPY